MRQSIPHHRAALAKLRLPSSVRLNLLLVVLAGVLPILAVILGSGWERRENEIAHAEHTTLHLAEVYAQQQEFETQRIRTILEKMAMAPEVQSLDPEPCNLLFRHALDANPNYVNFALLDSSGEAVASALPFTRQNLAGRKEFIDATATGAFAVGEYSIGRVSRAQILPYAQPVRDGNGRMAGVLIATLRLQDAAPLFDQARLPPESFVGLTDHRGLRLYRHPAKDSNPVGEPIAPRVWERTQPVQRQALLSDTGSDGIRRIIAVRRVDLQSGQVPYLNIFVGIPEALLVARADAVTTTYLTWLGLSLILSASLAWLVGKHGIHRRVARLVEVAQRLGAGDLSARSGLTEKKGVLGHLTTALDDMASSLEQDMAERKRNEALIARAREEAEAANLAKGEFLANMSHELRTPLNGVLGMLQLLDNSPHIAADDKVLLATAMESGRGLLTIINDILSFAQLDAGKLTIAREPASLREIVDSLCRVFHYEVEERGLSLVATVDDSVPVQVVADAGRLRQILLNLITNALKFTSEGRVEVAASMLPFSPSPTEKFLLISVTDTGIGIPDDKLDIVFEPFTQVDGALTRKYKGTGIGLGIVRQLVRLMGGTLCITSEVGVGVDVNFTIRCGTPPLEPCVETVPQEREVGAINGLRVLVAEDDRVNLFAATRFLELMGCKALGADNGRDAIAHLEREDFDCILMDVQMPEMDGVEATKAIRSSQELGAKSRIPIIAMTAHAMPGDRELFLAAGMDGYISKPVDMEELVRVVARAASRR